MRSLRCFCTLCLSTDSSCLEEGQGNAIRLIGPGSALTTLFISTVVQSSNYLSFMHTRYARGSLTTPPLRKQAPVGLLHLLHLPWRHQRYGTCITSPRCHEQGRAVPESPNRFFVCVEWMSYPCEDFRSVGFGLYCTCIRNPGHFTFKGRCLLTKVIF